jgi:hypothetical protein
MVVRCGHSSAKSLYIKKLIKGAAATSPLPNAISNVSTPFFSKVSRVGSSADRRTFEISLTQHKIKQDGHPSLPVLDVVLHHRLMNTCAIASSFVGFLERCLWCPVKVDIPVSNSRGWRPVTRTVGY